MKKCFLILFMISLPSFGYSGDSRIERAGDIGQYALPAYAIVLTSWEKDWKGLDMIVKSGVASMGVAHALKFSINSKRPNNGSYSFPSGHTASAFMGAAYLHRRYGLCFGIPAYVAASFVGYSRINSRKHYVVDVLAGAAIGIGFNYLFTFPRTCFIPIISQDCVGISASKNF